MALHDLDAILKLLDDADALTVFVRGPEVYVEKREIFEPAGLALNDASEVKSLLQALGQQVGRTLSAEEKVVNFRLADGKRVTAVNSPGAESPLICISR